MRSVVVPVILSGGSGTRLWPLSRAERPKQFLPLCTAQTLFQDTLLRLRGLRAEVSAPIVVCNEAHRFLVAEQLRALGTPARAIVLEPAGRNTAPAVGVAALLAERAVGGDARPLLLVLPADHVIGGVEAFRDAVDAALEAAGDDQLVTFGVVPDRPETGYGYIRRGAGRGRWSVLDEFVEKPDRAAAERYLASGNYLWNSGMFVFGAGAYLAELRRHAPDIEAVCRQAVAEAASDADFTRLGAAFLGCRSDSVDYAVMEKTERAAVVPLDAGWSDVGSWSALHDVLERDADGNTVRGSALLRDCRDTYVAADGRRVVAIGLDGCIIVDTPDAVLVMTKASSQALKDVVRELETASEAPRP